MRKAERTLQAIHAADQVIDRAEKLLEALEALGILGRTAEELSKAIAEFREARREALR